jgi:hypothetical protein
MEYSILDFSKWQAAEESMQLRAGPCAGLGFLVCLVRIKDLAPERSDER